MAPRLQPPFAPVADLNPAQSAAVRYIDGPLLVLAGAGSGKTRVITQKIAYLVRQCGIQPHQIAAVTFTNKAAREMKERTGKLLEGRQSRGLKVSTFHTLGLEIVRREHQRLAYKANFSIFDAQDCAALLREILRRDGHDSGFAEQAQWRISHWKNSFVLPDEAMAAALAAGETADIAASALYAEYQRHLKAYNAVDFDDLIMLPVLLFEQHAEVLSTWQNRVRYLLVDEYQDTNATQYRLVQLLVGVRGALTVVGDDDQSIYAWRGARPENLGQLQQDFPRLKVIKLEQNYRSTGCILKAANTLIAQNPHVFDKRLWSALGFGDPITVLNCRDEDHEAEKVVGHLIHHRFRERTEFRDYAILYRGNHQSRIFEKALREQRIPYQLSGGNSFFANAEVKDVMAYLRVLVNPDDDAAFLRVVNTPKREIGPSSVEKLAGYASGRGISLFAASFELGLGQHLSDRPLERLRRFAHWLVEIGDRARRGDPIAAVRDLVKEIDYASHLDDISNDARQAERRLENVEELITWLARMAQNDEAPESDLAALVNKISLMDILDRQNEQQDQDAIRLMTLHAAKGLEFPHVYLVGMEEELLPHRTSIEEGTIEEERRLAYVGVTRAQRTLTLSLAQRRRRGGERVVCRPSRFLEELPREDLRWEGVGHELPKEERQERGRAHLANLKGMLGQ